MSCERRRPCISSGANTPTAFTAKCIACNCAENVECRGNVMHAHDGLSLWRAPCCYLPSTPPWLNRLRNDAGRDLSACIAPSVMPSTRLVRARSRSRRRFARCVSDILLQICSGPWRRVSIRSCPGSNSMQARSRMSWPISGRCSVDAIAHPLEMDCTSSCTTKTRLVVRPGRRRKFGWHGCMQRRGM